MSIKRPMVRYFGGKWRLAPWIIEQLPAHRVYVEPYGGGGSVLLRKSRSYAEVYNDIDGDIVNLFTVARDHGHALKEKLELTPYARAEFDLTYEHPADCPIERARRTVARCFMGFGANAHAQRTGFRGNSNRSGTTPAHDWRNYPAEFVNLIERLRGVVIENLPAHRVMEMYDAPDACHYVDPPYVHCTRSASHRDAYRYEMSDADHEELCRVLKSLQGAVVLSGYDNDIYSDCLPGWTKITREAMADGARARVECLWLSRQRGLFGDMEETA